MTKVYEQIDESGLYRYVGESRAGRFVRATGPSPLKTMAEWLALGQEPPPAAAPVRSGLTVQQELCDALACWARRMPAAPAPAGAGHRLPATGCRVEST